MDEYLYAGLETSMIATLILFFCAFAFTQNGREFLALYGTSPLLVQVVIGVIIAIGVIEIPRVVNLIAELVLHEIEISAAKIFKKLTGRKTHNYNDYERETK